MRKRISQALPVNISQLPFQLYTQFEEGGGKGTKLSKQLLQVRGKRKLLTEQGNETAINKTNERKSESTSTNSSSHP